ncbi:lipopolysaccharide kinase InaA family protein [Endozoicomonas sp. 2B-B]
MSPIHFNELVSRAAPPSIPFSLELPGHGPINILTSLRWLPGKRLVAKALLNDQTVLLKCFIGSSAKRHFRRELSGIEGFQQAGVSTPSILNQCQADGFAFITTKFLDKSQSLDELWRSNLSEAQRFSYLKQVVTAIARLHRQKIIHNDPHLDNFLVAGHQLYLIDGGGTQHLSMTAHPRKALDNLALFLSVLFPKYDRLSLQCLPDYLAINPIKVDRYDFETAIREKRRWRERYLEKVFRTCTDFIAKSSFRRFQVIDRTEYSDALNTFLNSPDAFINSGQVLKRGRTNTVAVVLLDNGRKVFVKRYKSKKGLIHKYVRGFRQSRARNAWYIAHYLLRLLGVDTPKPIALLEYRIGRFITCSYLITEYVEARDALSFFTQQEEATPFVQKQAQKLLDIIEALKSGRVFHGDMKATNFMLTPERMMTIDLDQAIICKTEKCFQRLHKKDIERFARNWVDYPVAKQLFITDA